MIDNLSLRLTAMKLALVAFVAGRADEDREAGVVSVEYVVLGVAIIAIIGFLATDTAVTTALGNAFSGLFTKASNA